MEAGNWAEWATAVVALLALVAALWAGRAAWAQNKATLELLEVERKREDRAAAHELQRLDAEERAHQADQVAVWARYGKYGLAVMQQFHAEIHNQSPLPIYDVEVTFVTPDEQEWTADERLGVLPPGSYNVLIPDVLGRLICPAPEHRQARHRYSREELKTALRASIRFRDTAGRSWQRGRHGFLHRIEDDAI